MFGRSNKPTPAPAGQSGAQVAKLSTNLLQVIVSGTTITDFLFVLNGDPISSANIDNVLVSIEAPRNENEDPAIQAVLSTRGKTSMHQTNLFPGVIEITGLGRRIIVVGSQEGEVSVRLGLQSDGTSIEVHGLQSLSILLSTDIVSLHIKWTDGQEEDLLSVE